MRVAIMQPTYLPWAGYFGLMCSVDLFIYLDSVQFARRSWQQRNQIKTAKGAQWLTVPVIAKGKREQRIDEVEIDATARFGGAHRKAIEMNYRKAQAYSDAPWLMPLIEEPPTKLVDLTISLIARLREMIGISTPIARQRHEGEGTKADLLASLCREAARRNTFHRQARRTILRTPMRSHAQEFRSDISPSRIPPTLSCSASFCRSCL